MQLFWLGVVVQAFNPRQRQVDLWEFKVCLFSSKTARAQGNLVSIKTNKQQTNKQLFSFFPQYFGCCFGLQKCSYNLAGLDLNLTCELSLDGTVCC